jgi:gluconolactonase
MPDWIAEIDPRFKPCVLPNAPLLMLGEGYAWLEGPVWMADGNQLLVSDLPNDRILRWTEDSGVSIFRQPSNFPKGYTRDRQGRLIGCSHRGRCITRTELDGSVTVLADRFEGKRLNGPNDVVVANDDAIWFSDPHYGGNTDYEGGKHDPELRPYLYRLDPGGTLAVAADDFTGPNGLCFSPVGRIWSSAADGVHCLDPDGTLIGKILTGVTVSNLTFGGRNRCRLFICASHRLMAVYTNVRGAQVP